MHTMHLLAHLCTVCSKVTTLMSRESTYFDNKIAARSCSRIQEGKSSRLLGMVWLQVDSLLSNLGRVLVHPTVLRAPSTFLPVDNILLIRFDEVSVILVMLSLPQYQVPPQRFSGTVSVPQHKGKCTFSGEAAIASNLLLNSRPLGCRRLILVAVTLLNACL